MNIRLLNLYQSIVGEMKKIVIFFEKNLCFIINYFLEIMGIQIEKKVVSQFIRFSFIGVSNTILSYTINIVVLFAFAKTNVIWDVYLANIVAFGLSVLWSFFWNNKYVFNDKGEKKHSVWRTLLKTYASYGVSGIVLANFLSWIWVEKIGISKFIAPLINLVISVPVNFLLNKFWAFKND